jgi:hypothetical protein
VRENFRFGCEVQETEDLEEQLNPSKNQRGFGDHLAASALLRGDRCFRGDITRSDIFREKRPQQIVACGRVE